MILTPKAKKFWLAMFCLAAALLFAGIILIFSGHVGWGTCLIGLGVTLSSSAAQKLGHLKIW
jgi:hypothetical protein